MSLIYLSGISHLTCLRLGLTPPRGESFPCNTVKHDVHKHTLVTSSYDDSPRSAPSAINVGGIPFFSGFVLITKRAGAV